MAEQQVHLSIVCKSKQRKHPILIYSLLDDQSKCYKFQRSSGFRDETGHYYNCYECNQAKQSVEGFETRTIRSICVSANYKNFKTNPELLDHFCGKFEYGAMMAEQNYRFIFQF
jgi:hypothetical protein